MKKEINLTYGSGSQKIHFTIQDELALLELIHDSTKWIRMTPLGRPTTEPLCTDFQRINSTTCLITPGPYVGIVSLENCNLVFSPPKWLNNITSRNIFYMLLRANGLHPKTVYLPDSIIDQTISVKGFLEPLYHAFIVETQTSLKKGLFRDYISKEVISSSFKGQLDLTKQIELNSQGKVSFATKQHIFSLENNVNSLLYYACKTVEKNSADSLTLSLAHQAQKMLPKPKSNTLSNIQKIAPTNRSRHLHWAIQLAKLVINRESLSYEGLTGSIFSVVINLFDLFESYVTSELMIRDSLFTRQHELYLVDEALRKSDGWSKKRVFPDIVYLKEPRQVIDVKFKKITAAGPEISDVYQLFFYASMLDIKTAIIVYPENSDKVIREFPISNCTSNPIQLICYGLPITGTEENLTQEIKNFYDFLYGMRK